MGLNEVRPRRPEQYTIDYTPDDAADVSMDSGLDGRNNLYTQLYVAVDFVSQWSPA